MYMYMYIYICIHVKNRREREMYLFPRMVIKRGIQMSDFGAVLSLQMCLVKTAICSLLEDRNLLK